MKLIKRDKDGDNGALQRGCEDEGGNKASGNTKQVDMMAYVCWGKI